MSTKKHDLQKIYDRLIGHELPPKIARMMARPLIDVIVASEDPSCLLPLLRDGSEQNLEISAAVLEFIDPMIATKLGSEIFLLLKAEREATLYNARIVLSNVNVLEPDWYRSSKRNE